jgi:hypothetical protein
MGMFGLEGSEILFAECVGWAELALNESNNTGKCIFRGKFQEANAVNKNKRMYPYDVLATNVVRLEESMQARSLYGELDHPPTASSTLKKPPTLLLSYGGKVIHSWARAKC